MSLKPLWKIVKQEKHGVWVELSSIEAKQAKKGQVPLDVNSIVGRFDEVFHMPGGGLPPMREIEHGSIHKKGVRTINVRPY